MIQLLLSLILLMPIVGRAAATDQEFARLRLLELALEQTDNISSRWDPSQRDCAGFVRFLYRDAVTGRNPIFKNRNGEQVAFVSAAELIGYNFHSLGHGLNLDEIKTGDLLVFHRPDRKREDAWHIMILLHAPGPQSRNWQAIYHNGEQGANGQIRLVTIDSLLTTTFGEWRPNSQNPNFLGVFRWNGWKTYHASR